MAKDFRGKFNAYKQKSKIPDDMLHFWYKSHLSRMKPKERYWVIVFSKPRDYKHKATEKEWYGQIWIWDTQDEKWLRKFMFKEPIRICKVHPTYSTLLVISEHTWIFTCNFVLEDTCRETYVKRESNTKLAWAMPDEKTIIFDDKGGWRTLNSLNGSGNGDTMYKTSMPTHELNNKLKIVRLLGVLKAFITYSAAEERTQYCRLTFFGEVYKSNNTNNPEVAQYPNYVELATIKFFGRQLTEKDVVLSKDMINVLGGELSLGVGIFGKEKYII